MVEEDQTIAFVNLLTQSEKCEEILDKLISENEADRTIPCDERKESDIRDVTGKKKHLYRRR